jgi:hypothetical protein
MRKTILIKAILAVAGTMNGAGADVIWPSDGEWTALQQGTDL